MTANSSIQFQQRLPWGENLSVASNTNRYSDNSIYSLLDPSFGIGLNFTLTQPLIYDRGGIQERNALWAARNNVVVADEAARARVLQELSRAAFAYWEAVRAQAAVRMSQAALERALASYQHDDQAYKIGLIAKGDTLQTESEVTHVHIGLVGARQQAALTRNALRQFLGLYGATGEHVHLELLDHTDEQVWPAMADEETATAQAWRQRPDVQMAQRQIRSDQMQIDASHNALRPRVDLLLQAGSNGLGGVSTAQLGSPPLAPQGWSTALGQALAFDHPTYGATLQVSFPFRNSAAQADYTDPLIRMHADRTQVTALRQRVGHEIADAWENLRAARQTDELVAKLVTLARQHFDFERPGLRPPGLRDMTA